MIILADKKKTAVEVQAVQEVQGEPEFTKEQILASAKYRNRRDLVNALLVDGENYTLEKVNEKMNDFMKGQVK